MDLPLNYIVDKFYQYGGQPRFKQYRNVYEAGCPVCREGKSWGRKRRLYYLVRDNYLTCKNCQRTWSPMSWIQEVAGLTYLEVIEEAKEYDDSLDEILQRYTPETKRLNRYTLPKDCINLMDERQVNYYRNVPEVKLALKYLNERRMLSAVNRPKAYYTSVKDIVHSGRLIIPFADETGQIIFYQSRALTKEGEDYGKYLSKSDSEFSVFGIDRVDLNYDYIFQFEGPIDSMFVKNGVGMGGLSLTELQYEQLERYRLHKKIWVLDNQLDNKDVLQKYHQLIEMGERVFVCPSKFDEFKDLNEICVHYGLDQISPKFFIDNSYSGMPAMMELKTHL